MLLKDNHGVGSSTCKVTNYLMFFIVASAAAAGAVIPVVRHPTKELVFR